MNFGEMIQAAKDFWRPNRYHLDEFLVPGKKRPFALILPGGGYGMVCSFVEGLPYAKAINRMGYSAFVLKYRVRGKAGCPAPLDDVAAAVKYIVANADSLNVKADGYSIWGSSAGGHLAGCFCVGKLGWKKYGLPKPGAAILSYPVVTMGDETHFGSRKYFLGENPQQEEIELYSVDRQVTMDFPPTFLWCGDADRTVSPENSRKLAKVLRQNGVPFRFKEYSGIGHGVGLGRGLTCEGWLSEAVEFWEKE